MERRVTIVTHKNSQKEAHPLFNLLVGDNDNKPIGVVQSVLNKRKIKCACLGNLFNLPMITITIIGDALMIGMSGIMLVTMV